MQRSRRPGRAPFRASAVLLLTGLLSLPAGGCAVDLLAERAAPLPADTTSLARLINDYRASLGLPGIPVSPSLTAVAEAHVRDLEENRPDRGECNLHSWSDRGSWTPCCYTEDGSHAPIMWSKPAEITGGVYQGEGYEIAAWETPAMSTGQAFAMWKQSAEHRAVILNEGRWVAPWRALGVAVSPHYAVAWFGSDPDPAIQ